MAKAANPDFAYARLNFERSVRGQATHTTPSRVEVCVWTFQVGVRGALPKVTNMLTALQINAAKPAAKAYKLADGGGHLLAQPSGAELRRYKFRLAGVEGLAHGTYPVSLSQARQALRVRRLVAQGIHPVQERRGQLELVQAKLARERVRSGYLCRLGGCLIPQAAAGDHSAARARIAQKSAPAAQGASDWRDQSRRDNNLAQDVEKRAPEVARNLRGYLWGVFEYTIESGLVTANPVPSVRLLNSESNEPCSPHVRAAG